MNFIGIKYINNYFIETERKTKNLNLILQKI